MAFLCFGKTCKTFVSRIISGAVGRSRTGSQAGARRWSYGQKLQPRGQMLMRLQRLDGHKNLTELSNWEIW
jgi:hypothetical protein